MKPYKPQVDTAEAALQEAGLRVTSQRIVLLDVISQTADHPEVEDLHRRAQLVDPRISLATVYRTVSAFERAGLLHKHIFDGARARYERVNKRHHDHIVDVDTGEIVEFRSDEIEVLQARVAAELGYDVVHHRLELYCRKKA